MPTILIIAGWRLFFYSNEGNEPIHIHAEKADMECKLWLDNDNFQVTFAFEYGMNAKSRREVLKIVYEHFDYIVGEWYHYFNL